MWNCPDLIFSLENQLSELTWCKVSDIVLWYTWLREVAWEGNQTLSSDTQCTDYCPSGQAPQPSSLWCFSRVCKSSWPRGEGPHFCMLGCILTWHSLIAIWNFMWGRQEWDKTLLQHLASASPHWLLYLWRTWSVMCSVCRAGWKKHSVTHNCTNLILLNPIYPVGCLLWELIQDCAETCLRSTN